ncbi:MAG TPA: hypothetical protein PLB73_16255, partial [Leptospiraceae bacterium]|nr:hypothetical protein [Leptospiraceae bacterium]
MVDTMGHRARVKKQISFDPTPQLSQFQKDLKSVMECRADGPYRSQFASPDRFDPTSLHSLLQNEHRFKNQGEGKAVSDSFDIFDTSLGGVYFHQAEIMAGDGGSLAMLIAEPGATVESVRKALGWQRTNMSVPGFVRKIRKDKSGVVAMCMYVDPNERKVVAPAGLVMRERPSSSAPQSRMAAIGPVQNQPVLIPNGAIVSLRGCKGQRETVGDQQGTWCEIVYSPAMGMGAQGWVFGAVLEEIDY